MPFSVYILRCVDGSYYVGHTDDLERRLEMHQRGKVAGYTATRTPVELAWSDSFRTRDEAFARERQLKGWSRRKKQALIDGDWELLEELSRSRSLPPS
jgi:predicted GIY-YIG superfamily endonuclease